MAVAGSLANVIADSYCHFIDVINVNSKSVDIDRLKIINGNGNGTNGQSTNTFAHIKKIYNNHGYGGFFRGYSGCYYQGLLYGFTFFLIYRDIKNGMNEKFDK